MALGHHLRPDQDINGSIAHALDDILKAAPSGVYHGLDGEYARLEKVDSKTLQCARSLFRTTGDWVTDNWDTAAAVDGLHHNNDNSR